jgi:hypothetical protein
MPFSTDRPIHHTHRTVRTGLILGHTSLTIPQIEARVQRLNEAVSKVVARPTIRRKACARFDAGPLAWLHRRR